MNKEKIIQRLQQIKTLIEECVVELSSRETLKKTGDKKTKLRTTIPVKINFNMNERAFVKKYSKGMSYPKKFTLIVVYLSKGKCSIDVSLKDVEKLWKQMTAKDLLKGKFNTSYSTKAKTHGWVKKGTKVGFHQLDSDWIDVF